jgi:hydroxymethylbilane synthase
LAATGVEARLVPMVTSGDRGASAELSKAGLKGLFVAEIARALLDGDIDIAVNSAKDLTADDEPGLVIAAVPERASPLDVVVTRNGELPNAGVVGTSSLRRQAQVLRWRPDVLLKDVRGNVDSRLRKLAQGEVDAVILAAAGLLRLGIVPTHAAPMSVAEMVPAPGQGCLALQTRDGDEARDMVAALDHRESRVALEAERGLMARLGGGCALPLGAYATVDDGTVRLVGLVATPDGAEVLRAAVDAPTPEEAADHAADELRAGGADRILALVRS